MRQQLFRFKRVGTRLGAGFGVVLLLMVFMLATAAFQLWRIQARNAENERHTERLVLVQEWSALVRTNLDRALTATRMEAAVGSDDGARAHLEGVFSQLNAQMSDTAAATVELQKKVVAISDEPAVAALINKVNDARSRFVTIRSQVRDDIQMGEGGKRIDAELVPLAKSLLVTLDELAVHLKGASSGATQELASNVRQALVVLVLICLVALAAGAVIAWFTTRAIARPMHEAVDIADRISRGDLSRDFASDREDEIGAMLQRMAQMQQRLRAAVGEIGQATEQIGHASREVASGNADLAHRTEQAASRLQETSSSMDQMTGSVRHSAEAARTASGLATSSTQVARRGGDVVGQVVSTMEEINQSSTQIASIISVIDGIAFQTNILALNAAVEAARAGEQGRGFAVVAAEVRSLAQRSAQAAREIKVLIDTSVDKVGNGARLVREAGSTMHEIVDSVQRVTDMIAGISEQSDEQDQGIARMNQAVGQLDEMTQQNAALVEQSTAAAESLKDQAERLAGIVATFRLA